MLEAGHVAHRRIDPHIKILAGRIRNLEPEVRCVAGDVPILEAGLEPFRQFRGHRILDHAGLQEVLEIGLHRRQPKEEVLRGLLHRRLARDDRNRVDQVGWPIGRTTGLAVVAVLVGGLAGGTAALDETVGQEHAAFGIEGLFHGTGLDQPGVAQPPVDQAGQLPVLVGMRRMVIVVLDAEVDKVPQVFVLEATDQLLRRDALGLCLEHDPGAVGVVGTAIGDGVPGHSLITHPGVALDVLDHVTEVNRPVGVGQGAGDEQGAGHGPRVPCKKGGGLCHRDARRPAVGA